MRVIMIAPHFQPWGPLGGAEQQARKLIKELIHQGVDVIFVTGKWRFNEPRVKSFEGVPVYQIFTLWNMGGLKGLRRFATYIYMLSLLIYLVRHSKKYDLIHIHSVSPSAFIGVLAGKLLGKKTISKVMAGSQWSDLKRMSNNSMAPGARFMLPYIRRNCDGVVALNDEIAEELQASGFSPNKIVRIPNGVVINGLPKSSYTLQTPVRLIFVGRLQPQKGLDVLLQALAHLKTVRPSLCWQLQVFGEGPLEPMYRQQVIKLGLVEQIQFEGYVSDMLTRLTASDVFILPSRAEGISNALLEAMAAGLPCLVTDISGNRDLIEDNVNGLLVPSDVTEVLTGKLIELLDSQPLRERLARAARQTITQHYSIESVACRYLNLYSNLLVMSSPVELVEDRTTL